MIEKWISKLILFAVIYVFIKKLLSYLSASINGPKRKNYHLESNKYEDRELALIILGKQLRNYQRDFYYPRP